MKFIQLFTTSSLYLVLNSSSASASFLQGKSCEYLNDTCGRNKFCQAAPGDCRLKSASIPGNCVVPPMVCTANVDPVCGCDGKSTTLNSPQLFMIYALITHVIVHCIMPGNTYDNECEASAASVSIMSYGSCDGGNRELQCTSDNNCKSSEYCKKSTGTCGGNGTGKCTVKPQMCAYNYSPVCGCDDWTYGNACEAESAGENVDFKGECSIDPTECVPDDRPRPVRGGERFRFTMMGGDNAICTDIDGTPYEYGQFNNVDTSTQCSEACVNDVGDDLVAFLQGFDLGCDERICRCLFSRGTLVRANRGIFDSYNTNHNGNGSIAGAERQATGMLCFKLVGAENENAVVSFA